MTLVQPLDPAMPEVLTWDILEVKNPFFCLSVCLNCLHLGIKSYLVDIKVHISIQEQDGAGCKEDHSSRPATGVKHSSPGSEGRSVSGREHSQHWRPMLGGKSEYQKENEEGGASMWMPFTPGFAVIMCVTRKITLSSHWTLLSQAVVVTFAKCLPCAKHSGKCLFTASLWIPLTTSRYCSCTSFTAKGQNWIDHRRLQLWELKCLRQEVRASFRGRWKQEDILI